MRDEMRSMGVPNGQARPPRRQLNIDEAIAGGRIEAFYQPIARVETGGLCGMEALSRWRDPAAGLLRPQEYVPALEASGQVHKLDYCMLGIACRDLREAAGAGEGAGEGEAPLPVSVNLSRADFSREDLVGEVKTTVGRAGSRPGDVVLEVTESAVADRAALREKIAALRDAGFAVWMDDFGTGASSLASLSELDFDGIKLDMSFLMAGTQKARVIMRHAVAMARELGIGTLAEGVQSAGDLAFLREIGCERAQGSYIGDPAPRSPRSPAA